MSLSDDRLIGLYRLNQHLLEAALTTHSPGTAELATAASAIADIGSKLDRGGDSSADAIASCTGRLFSSIVQLSGNAQAAESVARINDRLHSIRKLEHAKLDDVAGELIDICELFLADRFEEAATAVATYHTRRTVLLPELVSVLRK